MGVVVASNLTLANSAFPMLLKLYRYVLSSSLLSTFNSPHLLFLCAATEEKKRKERGKETHYSTLNYVTASSSIGILTCTPCSAFRSTASSGHIRFTLLSEKGPRCACFALCISACFSSLHCPLSALSAFQLYCFIVLFFCGAEALFLCSFLHLQQLPLHLSRPGACRVRIRSGDGASKLMGKARFSL